MKHQIQVRLAWKIIAFLESLTDLILEHYHDELIEDYYMKKLKTEDALTQ